MGNGGTMNTRAHVMHKANELFHKNGFQATSIKDICQAAEVSRVTFYHYFKNKLDIIFAIRMHDIETYITDCSAILHSDAPFLEKVEQYIAFRVGHHKHMEKKLASDIIQLSPDSEAIFQRKIEYINQMFVEFILKAQRNGDVNSTLTSEKILFLFNIVVQTAQNDDMLQFYPTVSQMVQDLLDFFFFGIIGRRA
jgi:AcrR family transcriptional regulator